MFPTRSLYRMPVTPLKICIEGNIGCGKTSVMRRINEKTRMPIFLEPVDEWAHWLNLFYEDPQRWGFTFNVEVLMSFNKWSNVGCTAVYERSPLACKSVFTEIQYKDGHLTYAERELFMKLFAELSWKQDVIIYLKCDPEICFQRMNQRGRECESHVPLEYLKKVHDQHEEMMGEAERKGIRVITVDASKSSEEVLRDVLAHIDQLVH